MKVIGLTGGIGSGKSTFCDLMAQYGIATIDTDRIARQVVEPGTEGLKAVVKAFGEDILNTDGSLNRQALRNRIFADPADQTPRQKLEAILHPLIQNKTLRQVQTYRENPDYQKPFLLVAIPLLVEGILKKGGHKEDKPNYIDEIWVLDCAPETQLQRAIQRDGVSSEQVRTILANQATRQQRLQYADKVINNEKGLEELELQIKTLL